ncbi:MAG: ankyrin repeat domain-containing protein, partial [Firmicutes bacterium]|nr:ankyrin repeat domain-containing protein [Bacillota bacterium]
SFKEDKLLKKREKSNISEKMIDFIKSNKKKLIGLGLLATGTIFYYYYKERGDNAIPIYLEKDYKKLKLKKMSVKEFQDKIKNYYIKKIKEIKNKKLKSMSAEMLKKIELISKETENITKCEHSIGHIGSLVADFRLLFDITYIDTSKVETFLMENFSNRNKLEIEENLKKFLNENKDIDINLLRFYESLSDFGGTYKPALMLKYAYKNYAIAKALIEVAKIDVNIKDYHGLTALMAAIKSTDEDNRNESEKVVKLLTEVPNIDLNAADINGMTALMYAVEFSCEEIIKLMLNTNKVKINKQDKKGNTALFYLFEVPDEELFEKIFEILLEYKADITIKNKDGQTILHHLLGNDEKLKILLKQKEINKIANEADKEGRTPLILAILQNWECDIVELLVGEDGKRAGIDVNVPNKNNVTPLMLAAKKNSERMVKALLEAGAKKYVKDNYGKTALDYATSDKIKDLLKNN